MNLSNTNLTGASLVGVFGSEGNELNLTEANVTGADLRVDPEIVDKLNIEGATYNADTKWPAVNSWDEPFSADEKGALRLG